MYRILSAVVLLLLLPWPLVAQNNRSVVVEETVGPFPSWVNITSFGANGGDALDDTTAFQAALNSLYRKAGAGNAVLYIPDGTYRISTMLHEVGTDGVMIVGQSTAGTIIKWFGAAGGTLWRRDGVAYTNMRQMTLDGSGTASRVLDQSCTANQTGQTCAEYFDDGNQYTDMIFKDGEYGYVCGEFHRIGCATSTLSRVDFLNFTAAGAIIANFNALEIFFWDAYFDNCARALTNDYGAGNWRVYRSLFRGSTEADMWVGNAENFSARGNTSVNAQRFFHSRSGGARIPHNLQANVIIDPIDDAVVFAESTGPIIMFDNQIRSRPGATAPIIDAGWADVIAVGNTFNVASPYTSASGRLRDIDTTIDPLTTLPEPALPTFRVPHTPARTVYEVTSASDIQVKITAAHAANNGNRPIVHIPAGDYTIGNAEAITIPAGSDVQLVGDGFRTRLFWGGSVGGTMLTVVGPTKATLRDLFFWASDTGTTIKVTDTNQAGSRVLMDDFYVLGGPNSLHNVLARNSPQSTIDILNYESSGVHLSAATMADNATIRMFASADSNSLYSLGVRNNGTVIYRDGWYEYESDTPYLNLDGVSGSVYLQGRGVYVRPTNTPTSAYRVNNFTGNLVILGGSLEDQLSVEGDGTNANVLLWGWMHLNADGFTPTFLNNTSTPAADVRLFDFVRMDAAPPPAIPGTLDFVRQTDIGAYDANWFKDRVAPLRAVVNPAQPSASGAGVTDARLYRLIVSRGLVNLNLQGAAVASNPPTVTIQTPTTAATYPTTAPLLTLAGSATDDEAITLVTVRCVPSCGTPSVTGTTSWSAANVPLTSGSNVLTVTVYDGDTQLASDTLTVTYTPLIVKPGPLRLVK